MRKNSLVSFVLLLTFIKEALLQSITVMRIQTEVNKLIIPSPIPSSMEGHSLIIISGSGFSVITKSFSCVLTSLSGSRFNYTVNVNKAQSVCEINNYECNYQMTSYSLSDNQIACYSPKINENDRQAIIDEGGTLRLSIQIDGIPIPFTCPSTNDCLVKYNPNYTPTLLALEPTHFYIGQNLSLKLIPRLNTVDKFNGIKLDRFFCPLFIPEDYSDSFSEMLLSCSTGGDYIVEKITNFTVSFSTGFVPVPSFFKKQDVDPNLNSFNTYYFKSFPRIDEIGPSLNGSTTGGQTIWIKGSGFMEGKTKVFIDKDECEIQNFENNIQTQTVYCKVKTSTFDPSNPGFFISSRGLRQRVYNVNSISKMTSLVGFPNNITNLSKDDVLLETNTPSNGLNNYAQYIIGYFKAIYSGQYRFWATSDDVCQVYLSNDTNPINKTKIIDFNGWTNYLDFVTQSDKTRSQWITLSAGNLYYIEILHSQGSGLEHFRLGVEINLTSTNSTLSTFPNQIYKIHNITLSPLASRDLYEFRMNLISSYSINTNNPDGTIKSSILNATLSANSFRNILSTFTGESRLIVRKIGYNDKDEYYLNSTETPEDSSFTNLYSFSDMYLAPSTGNSPFNPVSTGTKKGVVFLVLIDRKFSERTTKWENTYYLSSSGSSIKVGAILKQSVSPEISGTFRLKVKDNLSGIEYESRDLDSSNLGGVQSQLDLLAPLTGKIQVYVGSPDNDKLNFYIRYGTYSNITVSVSNNSLSGGRDPNVKPSIIISDFIADSKNLFFMPIPSDFLYMINNGPQVNVIVDGFEAVCPRYNCTFNYIQSSSRPTVQSYTFDSTNNQLSIVVDNQFNDSSTLPFVKMGKNVFDKTSLTFISSTKSYNLKLPQNVIGGSYIPILSTDLGDCGSASTLSPLIIPIKITSCSPSSSSSSGGDVISITGSGFPFNIDNNFIVTVGGTVCKVLNINNTQVNCTLGVQISGNTDPLTINYNNVSISASDSIFKYITSANAPAISTVTPNNISPGEKQFITIKFNSNINSYALNGITVKMVHKINGFSIFLNPKNISNNDTLYIRYGGARPGEYNLYVKLDSTTYASGSPIITSGFTITSITPNVGSINGGTIVYIKGTNFLSTQVNQMIFIGKTTCLYKSNNNTDISCLTQPPNVNTPIDTDLAFVIDQMIQYSSNCSIAKPSTIIDPLINDGCLFRYSSEKTAFINNIVSKNNDYIFSINDTITINGGNFSYTNSPSSLSFDWGKITVTSSDKNTKIEGTISEIKKWGLFKFDFNNEYGLASHVPNGTAQGLNSVQIFLKKPSLIINSSSPSLIGEYGAIFKFYTETNDFTINPNNKISICGIGCTVLQTNLLTDDKNNFQCIISTPTPVVNFTECDPSLSYYGLKMNLNLTNKISSASTKTLAISKVYINNVDINSNAFTGISDSTNFQIQVEIIGNNINLQGLKLIVDNQYVFSANSPGVIMNNNAVYTFNMPNGLPAGTFTCSVHEDSVGFLKHINPIIINSISTSAFLLNINIKLNTPSVNIDSSFYGGITHSIIGYNLNKKISPITDLASETMINNQDNSSFQKVLVCGFPAQITQYNTRKITYITPTLLQYNFFKNLPIMQNSDDLISSKYNYILEYFFDSSVKDTKIPISLLTDGDIYSKYDIPIKTSTNTPFIGMKLKTGYLTSNLRILLQKIKIHVSEKNKPSDFDGGYIEASNDNITWIKLSNIPSSIPFLWFTISIDYSLSNTKLFKYIRFVPNTSISSGLAEIRFLGNVVYDDSTSNTALCDVNVVDNYNNLVVPNVKVKYDTSKTLVIKKISPQTGTSLGGQTVKVTLNSSFSVDSNTITTVSLNSNTISSPITYDSILTSRILQASNSYNTIVFTMVKRNNDIYDSTKGLQISISGYGNVYSNGLTFKYLDRWSDTNTWGGEFIPANGETAYIKNTDVLLDVSDINLNTLVIENGSLIVEDTRDYNISAWNIMVRSGSFIVGTEDIPFTHKFILTMKSSKFDPSLPIFGNKVLAVLEGNLSLQGKPRNPTWTVLSKSALSGDTTITVDGSIDWNVGEEIAISSSSTNYLEAERRFILQVTGASSSNPVITLDQPLKYSHYGEIETYGNNDVIDMRAEVILLTRNIVIQGDENSVAQQYGSHIMITSMSMNMNLLSGNTPFWGKIAYIEVRRAGQAYQLGRYPIHFHMIGDVTGSYVRGCSIHDTFNRAVTIHGVNNFLVEYNVAFNVMGHTFFIEDGVETNNIIRKNVAMVTKASYSLLNTDYNPASFWITNPSNYFEGNRAAGSQFYGIWMELPIAPTGVSLGVKTCPRDYPLGSFKENVAHSNGKYGFRIFPEFTPKSKPCVSNEDPNLVTVQAMFTSSTIYKNGEKGLVTERIGNLLFSGFKLADNPQSSFEISDLIPFPEGSAKVQNTFIIGKSNNKVPDSRGFATSGLITPRNDNFTVSDIRFYNFNVTGYTLFASCSRCEVAAPSTDSDGRTIFFEKIKYESNVNMMVHWFQPKKAIYRDLDGTLTGQSGPGWVTPYYPHLLVDGSCRREPKWEDGVICDDSVQLRRLSFYEATPSSSFSGQNMKILRVKTLDNIPLSDLADTSKFSIIGFKEKKDPSNAWTSAFVTGYNYLISFGYYGLDFNSISIERSKMWESSDKPLNLLLNYTARRDEFNIKAVQPNYTALNSSNLTTITDLNDLTKNNINYGTFFNNIQKRQLLMRMTGLNPAKFNSKISISAIQCSNNDCGIIPPNDKPPENFIRKWSNPNDWPNNKKPSDGENVEILQEWTMIIDENTSKLNNLVINGNLFFDNTVDNLVLSAKTILILKGKLEVGTQDNPYTKRVNIQLLGDRFSMNLVLSNLVQLPNKVLTNVGNLNIYGEDRAPYKSRLLMKGEKGTKKLKVESGLKWRGGDEIVITTTTWNNNETERFTILTYSNETGELTINGNLNYNHYGFPIPTILKDNPLIPQRNLDERAEVYMISRNVRISGSDNEGWGCNVFTTIFPTSNFTYSGRTNISNAEIVNCGQLDTEFSALQFRKHNNKYSQSFINGVSFYDNPYMGISIQESKNISINNTIMFQQKKFGLYVLSSTDISLNDISVIQMKKREYPVQFKVNKLIDTNTCFYVCPEGVCNNINFTNSTCAGSDMYGFVIDGYDCNLDLTKNYNYHFSYATSIGFLILNAMSKDCMKIGNAIAYNNYGAGFGSYTVTNYKFAENIISSSNLHGLAIMTSTSIPNSKKIMKRVLIMGQNKENPTCLTDLCCALTKTENIVTKPGDCKQIGFYFSGTTTGEAISAPFTGMMFPVNHLMGDSQFGSFFEGSDVVISNFEDQCAIPQVVFNSNDFASDFTSIHIFKNLTLFRVLEDNLLYFLPPSPGWIGEPCGDFPCSGPNNVLIKISNFKRPSENASNSEIVPNSKWNNSRKVYVNPFILNTTQQVDIPNITLNDGVSFIPKLVSIGFADCQSSTNWNSYICSNKTRNLGILIGENIEPESNARTITPINITSLDISDPFNNKLNSFMDHACENGYPSHKRTARIPGLLTLGKNYNYSITSTPPKKMKFQLIDPDWDPNSGSGKNYSGVSLQIQYTSPQTVLVYNFNSGMEYKSKQWKDGEVFNLTTCGANKWTPVKNTLQFYITNSPDCVLMINTVNSVQLSLRFDITVEDFYKKNGDTQLIYNIAAVLGISPDQIRITNVMVGSTIALTQILQSTPGTNGTLATNAKTIDLNNAVNVIVNSIKSGTLSIPAPILSLSYAFAIADNTTSVSNMTNTTGIITGDGTIISINVLNNTSNSTSTNNSDITISNGGITIVIFNNSFPYYPIPSNTTNSSIVTTTEKNNLNLLWLLVIPIFFIILAGIIWVTCRIIAAKRIQSIIKEGMTKLPVESRPDNDINKRKFTLEEDLDSERNVIPYERSPKNERIVFKKNINYKKVEKLNINLNRIEPNRNKTPSSISSNNDDLKIKENS